MITATQTSILKAILLTLRDIDRVNERIERIQRDAAQDIGVGEFFTFKGDLERAQFFYQRAARKLARVEELRRRLVRDERNLQLLVDAFATFPS